MSGRVTVLLYMANVAVLSFVRWFVGPSVQAVAVGCGLVGVGCW